MPNEQEQQTIDEALRLAQQRLQPPAGAAAGTGLDLTMQLLQQFGPQLAQIGLQIFTFLKGRGTTVGGGQPDHEAVARYVENAARHAPALFAGGPPAQQVS